MSLRAASPVVEPINSPPSNLVSRDTEGSYAPASGAAGAPRNDSQKGSAKRQSANSSCTTRNRNRLKRRRAAIERAAAFTVGSDHAIAASALADLMISSPPEDVQTALNIYTTDLGLPSVILGAAPQSSPYGGGAQLRATAAPIGDLVAVLLSTPRVDIEAALSAYARHTG